VESSETVLAPVAGAAAQPSAAEVPGGSERGSSEISVTCRLDVLWRNDDDLRIAAYGPVYRKTQRPPSMSLARTTFRPPGKR
jgi:hypothetical protein